MDYNAQIEHQKLMMSRNPIVVNVDPVVLLPGASRVDLRYFVEVQIQSAFQSGTFVPLPMQEASEKPIPAGYTSSPGAFFEIQTRIDDQLKSTPPEYGNDKISICPDLTRQYYYRVEKYNGDDLVETFETTTVWAIRAQLAMRHYSMYKDMFFNGDPGCVSCKGHFLTWQPDGKMIREDQPEFLYFLTNFTPTPKELHIRVRIRYSDNSYETKTALTADNISAMTVYCIPSGYSLVKPFEKTGLSILSYDFWISNEDDRKMSQIRTFRIDRAYFETVKYILFQNSLGGYDTLRCVGSSSESVTVNRQVVERFVDYDYLPTVSEMIINNVTGQRQINLNTGNWLSEEHRDYLEDLLLSEEFYIADNGDFIPLIPGFTSLVTQSVTEWPIERALSFTYSNEIGGYSRLPKITPVSRPTGWIQYSISCELNANGLRTGRQIVNELVKYYLDSGERVKPIVTKANIAGTEGYIEPWVTDSCAALTTPFRNAVITGSSKLKRSTCSNGLVGTTWTITIAANSFGSEVSQADADAKALAAWSAQDTQAKADANGNCIAAVNMYLSLLNNCPGDFRGQTIGGFNPIVNLQVDGVQLITNTAYSNGGTRNSEQAYPARKVNYDVQILFSDVPTKPYKISLPSKNLSSGVLNGPTTFRFANIETAWGDEKLVFRVDPA